MRAALLLLVPACAWNASDERTEVRTVTPLVLCAGRTDPMQLGGVGGVVFDGLTGDPALTNAALAIAPVGGLGGTAPPAGAPISLVSAGEGAYRASSAPSAGLWTLTVDGIASVTLVVAPQPAPTAPLPAVFCRSEPQQTLSFLTDQPLYHEIGRRTELLVAGQRVVAFPEDCVAAPLAGVERCTGLRAAVATASLPDAVSVALATPCTGVALSVPAIPGPLVVRMMPSTVGPGSGRTTRARVDDTVGDIGEVALRPSGTSQPFVVVPSVPLSSGTTNERVEVTLPDDLPLGLYDVLVRDQQCAATGLAALEVVP